MTTRIELDFRYGLTEPRVEQRAPMGPACRSTRGQEQLVVLLPDARAQRGVARGHRRPAGAGVMLNRVSEPFSALNGWGRLLGFVGVPGAISLYLVWWLTQGVGGKLDRIIQLLEQIARALKVTGA